MFFRRKQWTAMPWQHHVKNMRRRYARRLSDRLNRKLAEIPAEKMRPYVLVFLVMLTAFNLMVLLRAFDQLHGWKESPASSRLKFKSLQSIRAWHFDDWLYDSLKKQRPGLADTLKMFEHLY